MITSPLLYAAVLGVVTAGVVYLALSGFDQDRETHRSLRFLAVGIGAAAAWWGIQNPALIEAYSRGFLGPGQAVALAALGVVFLYWRLR